MIIKLFEFNILELRKNKDIDDFFKKVKSENPDIYSRFVSIVSNKGLDIAKEKYKQYDPEYQKTMKKKETTEKRREERNKNIEHILNDLAPKINKIEEILSTSPLKNLLIDIKKNNKLNTFLFKDLKCKKTYKNVFSVINKTKLGNTIRIDTLNITKQRPNYWFEESKHSIIRINQYYRNDNDNDNDNDNKLSYSIYFNVPTEDEIKSFTNIDNGREYDYVRHRNSKILKLTSYHLTKDQIYEKIFEDFLYLISDEYYDEWKFQQDTKKYNL